MPSDKVLFEVFYDNRELLGKFLINNYDRLGSVNSTELNKQAYA